MSGGAGDGGTGRDRLREMAGAGEQFVAVGEDGEGHVVIAVAVPGDRAAEIAATTGMSVGRVEDDEMERLVVAFFPDAGDPHAQEPAFVLALAPAVPEQRAHLATLARAERASLVVLEVPSGEQRAVRPIGPAALDQLRELSREAGIEGA